MRRKKLLIALSSVIAFILLLAVLAPTLLSGYVRGVVEREVAARVNGTVAVTAIELGWFSSQKVAGLVIDGGAEIGRIDMGIEVSEGLLALARGSDITLKLAGAVATSFDAQGRIGLARLAKPAAAGGQDAAAPAPAPAGSGGTPLGTRTLRIELAGIDLSATGPDGAAYALENLDGTVSLAGTDLAVALDAVTRASGREGELSVDADASLAFRPDGSADIARTSGKALVAASRITWPTAAGELDASTLRLELSKSAQGEVALKADVVARVAGSSEATLRADVALGTPFDAAGAFALDPSEVIATVEARGVPMAAFQPFAPVLAAGTPGETRVDLAKDIGDTADLSIVKRKGDGARVALESRHLQFVFEGAVAPDGSSIENGTISSRLAVRPELLAAFGLLESTPLEASLRGERIGWRKGDDAIRAVSGAFEAELAKPLAFRLAADPLALRADTLRLTLDKAPATGGASATVALAGRYGERGDTTLSATAELDLASRALTRGALDATARLDPAYLERVSGGAVAARGKDASLRISVPELAYIPSEEYSGLRALIARARVELSGALSVEGAGTTAAVNDLGLDLAMPRGGKPGTIALGARVDGAAVRVEQRFGPLPAGALDLASLAPEGSVAVDGLDPSFIARLAPAAARQVGLLGSGPLKLDLKNRTDRGAVLADFSLDATALDASGAISYRPDAIAATNLVVESTLTAEALASLDLASLGLGEATEIEPGARITLRAPTIALARTAGADGAPGAWAPAGDVALRATVNSFRIRRAPGIVAPLGIHALDATASYAFADERATVNGMASLGGGGTAGNLEFALAWRKPAEAKLFAGAEGSLALTAFDLARFEPSFGLEAGQYSGILGGPGALRITFAERGAPSATVALEFPKTRGNLELSAPEDASGRSARVRGALSADLSAETFTRLAGLGKDPSRRVTQPVSLSIDITSASVPLDRSMKPQLGSAAIDAKGALSAVQFESVDAAGKKVTLSTGALALTVASTRLADEVVVRVTGTEAGASTGTLDVDARVRGIVAPAPATATATATAEGAPSPKANPVVDATIRATRFPAATIDALAATGGAVGRYLGDAIDTQVDARNLSATGGTLAVALRSDFATLDAPELSIADGALTVAPAKPVAATFALSPAVREQLLASINPVFSDISTGAPAKFALSALSWPLDGDRSKFDAAFTLETGEVRLVNSGTVSGLLALASAGRTDGFEAFLDPLRGTVAKGRLTYRDFALRAGKTAQGTWRNSLVFTGDIDLASKPIRANSIVTAIPLADAANWSKDARGVVDALNAANPELVKALAVGIELYGPLFDPAGKPVAPSRRVKLPEIGDILRDNPGAIIDAAGGIADLFRKKKKDEAPPAAPPK